MDPINTIRCFTLILEEVARKPARTYCIYIYNLIYAHIVNRYHCLHIIPPEYTICKMQPPQDAEKKQSQANEPTHADNFSMSEAKTGMNVVTCQPRKNPLSFSLEIMAIHLLWHISENCLAYSFWTMVSSLSMALTQMHVWWILSLSPGMHQIVHHETRGSVAVDFVRGCETWNLVPEKPIPFAIPWKTLSCLTLSGDKPSSNVRIRIIPRLGQNMVG